MTARVPVSCGSMVADTVGNPDAFFDGAGIVWLLLLLLLLLWLRRPMMMTTTTITTTTAVAVATVAIRWSSRPE